MEEIKSRAIDFREEKKYKKAVLYIFASRAKRQFIKTCSNKDKQQLKSRIQILPIAKNICDLFALSLQNNVKRDDRRFSVMSYISKMQQINSSQDEKEFTNV